MSSKQFKTLAEVLGDMQEQGEMNKKGRLEAKQKEERVITKPSYPWDKLDEEQYSWFMDEVADIWQAEQYKERRVKTYDEVLREVWERWDKGER